MTSAPDGEVRRARPDDLSRLRAIQTATLAEPRPELLSLGVRDPLLCLVYAGPTPTGYALAVVGEPGESAYLAELAVAPGFRDEGRGGALVDALFDRLRSRGVSRLRVTVRAVDDRALSFYRERGFTVEERLPDHYENCDGRLLARTICASDED
ncbi:MAG: GNAT family N-acetyltransferase [Haloarculaceae archaeon]